MFPDASNPDKSHEIDRNQAKALLEALGYKSGDPIYIRAIHPDKKNGNGAENFNKLNYRGVEKQQIEKGRNIYFVVNGGGHKDADVKSCRAIFFEHDNLDKEVQKKLWQTLALPQPTVQVDTGGKSIHSYFAFNESVTPQQWVELQTDLLKFVDGDRKLSNPSRVMRLAGAWYMKPDGTTVKQSTIISNSGKRYTYEELRAIIPRSKVEVAKIPLVPIVNDTPPLHIYLRIEDRNLIESGIGEGDRNDKGAMLARNLIGTSLRLPHLGLPFAGDPRQLFDGYCARCSPPLGGKEADTIWRSAKKDNPSSTLTDDALENCYKAWKRNQEQPANKTVVQMNHSSGDQQPKVAEVSLRDRILDIISRKQKKTERKTALLELGKVAGISQRDLEELAKELEQEQEAQESQQETKEEIDKLLQLSDNSINLADYLPEKLARPITQWCNWMNIRPAIGLTAVLTAASSLHKTGTELIISASQDFQVPPTIYSALVAESGQRKSPVLKTLVKKPLGVLNKRARDRYKEEMEEYEQERREWEQKPKGEDRGSPPKEPVRTVYYFSEATGEGIKNQVQKVPDKALLALIDELASLFKSANKYRSGRGSDMQDLLSYFDGTGQSVLRADGLTVDVDRVYISIFGTIQPDVLRDMLKDGSDPDGQWARFLFINQPMSKGALTDEGGIDLVNLLCGIYERIDALPVTQYKLTKAAFKRYREAYSHLGDLQIATHDQGLRAVYAKMCGYIGRLAVNLHVLEAVSAGSVPSIEIDLPIIEKAVSLVIFYLDQAKLVRTETEVEQGALPPLLAKLYEKSLALGELTARKAQSAIFALRKVEVNTIVGYFCKLQDLGYGEVKNKKFIPKQKVLMFADLNADGFADVVKKPESHINQDTWAIKIKSADVADVADGFRKNFEDLVKPAPQEKSEILEDHQQHQQNGLNTSQVPTVQGFSSADGQHQQTHQHFEKTSATSALEPVDNNVADAADKVADNAADTSPQIKTGDRVIVHCPGSKRDGKTGAIERITNKGEKVWATVLVDGETGKSRRFDCLIPGTEDMHLKLA